MGREVKRVPADFHWPYQGNGNVWKGYIMPKHLHPDRCYACEASGLNPETKRISDEWYDSGGFVYLGQFPSEVKDEQILTLVLINGGTHTYRYGQDPNGHPADHPPWKVIGETKCWQHNITQDEVDALIDNHRLIRFTHIWKGGDEGWVKREDGYTPTAEDVNRWSHHGFGHDAINQGVCVEARARRLGVWGKCEVCHGEGHLWEPGQKQAQEAWERTEPPTGPAYQIWETVSQGSPISPPFLNPEDLARWMVGHDDSITEDTSYEEWLTFITECGHAPAMGTRGDMKSGVQGVVEHHIETTTQPTVVVQAWDEWTQKPAHVDPGEVEELFKRVAKEPGTE